MQLNTTTKDTMFKSRFTRFITIGAGCSLLLGVGAAAVADEVEHGQDNVEVEVEIAEINEPGVLAMTVAGEGSTALEENGSDDLVRQFTGTLPTVTVTDTRAAEDIAGGAAWYVLGSATDFTAAGSEAVIEAKNLGWKPHLVDGGESGLVTEGEEVGTALETDKAPHNVGLVDQELLAMAFDSQGVIKEGQWQANAELTLHVPATVEPGTYSSQLTLSLFE